ncbi:MAG: TA system VapC family ribonuclease toxin, partial [Planctomycetota bacterium]
MLLLDVNVLVYAHREDAPDHERYRAWLESMLEDEAAFGVSDLVLSGLLRIVTHPRVFAPPTPLETALAFAREVRAHPNRIPVAPGHRHWEIFVRLC